MEMLLGLAVGVANLVGAILLFGLLYLLDRWVARVPPAPPEPLEEEFVGRKDARQFAKPEE